MKSDNKGTLYAIELTFTLIHIPKRHSSHTQNVTQLPKRKQRREKQQLVNSIVNSCFMSGCHCNSLFHVCINKLRAEVARASWVAGLYKNVVHHTNHGCIKVLLSDYYYM